LWVVRFKMLRNRGQAKPLGFLRREGTAYPRWFVFERTSRGRGLKKNQQGRNPVRFIRRSDEMVRGTMVGASFEVL